LSWTGGDPDVGDTVTYDVYFGTTSPPPKVIGNQTSTTYNLPTLAYNTKYYWKIVSWDNHGASSSGPIWSFTTVQQPNNPPYVPSNPSPANGATGVSVNADLSWTGGDPDVGNTVTYDVYFGTTSSPPKVIGNQTSTTYNLPTLSYNTRYYWKIVSWDNHGASSSGPIWSFTTEQQPNNPPYVPSNPNPANGATGVSINADLSWTGGDPDVGDTVTYDVYFGTTNPPQKIFGNKTGASYNLPTLSYNTRYYWKIVSWDNHGASSSGPSWSFTTEQQPNNPPNPPSNPVPSNGAIGVLINTDLSWTGGDPDPGDTVTYDVFFGTVSPPQKVNANQSATMYDLGILTYNTTYYWKIAAWDNHGASTAGPIWSFTTETGGTENHPPETPTLDGPTAGTNGVEYAFFANTTDPETDQVYYNFSWGDNTTSGWVGPYNSSETIDAYHAWTIPGEYEITVKAKDIYNAESNWSEPLSINISSIKHIEITNIKPGFVYFRVLSGESYFYVHLLEVLDVSVILGSSLQINASVTEQVHTVQFNVTNLLTEESTSFVDNNTTDGISYNFDNIPSGLISITATAYDATGNEIGNQTLTYVLYINIGSLAKQLQNGKLSQLHSTEKLKGTLHQQRFIKRG
jgi:hypothetical protein